MRLRTKFFLITATATIVPVVGATLAGRALVQRTSRAEFRRLLSDGEQEVRAQYEDLRREVAKAAKRIANPDDHFIGPLLIALAKGGPDDEMFRQLPTMAPRVMRERGLDVLTVLGPKRRVLASGHFPGRTGDTEPRWPPGSRAKTRGRRPTTVLMPLRVMQGGRPKTRLTVVAWRWARSPLGTRVRVAAGRFLDKSFVRRLRLRGDTQVLIKDATGQILAQPTSGWKRYARYPQRVTRLRGPDGKVVATLTLAASDARLKLTLEVINYLAGALALGALLLSLLIGALVRPIARPLEQLVVAAEAVAAGDLEHRIPERRRRDEVGELIISFNRMTSELADSKQRLVAAERVAAWREIARRIAHEIKNPLFPIQTSIETLRKVHAKKHPDFEEIFAESTATILEEVERLKHIVTEFSNFARLPKPSPQRFDVGEWLQATVGLYATDGLEAGVQAETGLELVGDREQLTQVLANLVQNARDATRAAKQPKVEVTARRVDDLVELAVRDNGGGVDAKAAGQLFVPYFTTKKDSGGTGLGLAICHRIITDHGGTIEAASEPGRGACFVVRLPEQGPQTA